MNFIIHRFGASRSGRPFPLQPSVSVFNHPAQNYCHFVAVASSSPARTRNEVERGGANRNEARRPTGDWLESAKAMKRSKMATEMATSARHLDLWSTNVLVLIDLSLRSLSFSKIMFSALLQSARARSSHLAGDLRSSPPRAPAAPVVPRPPLN